MLQENIFASIVILLIMISVKIISKFLTKRNCLGIGDAKLFSLGAAWLGLRPIFIVFMLSFISAAIFSIFDKLFNYNKGKFHPMPFAPFISVSIFSVWVLSEDWWIESWMSLWGF